MFAQFRCWFIPMLCGCMSIMVSALFTASAWAADDPPEDDNSRWATGYLLVTLCIALGLVAILISSRRTTELRRIDDDV